MPCIGFVDASLPIIFAAILYSVVTHLRLLFISLVFLLLRLGHPLAILFGLISKREHVHELRGQTLAAVIIIQTALRFGT